MIGVNGVAAQRAEGCQLEKTAWREDLLCREGLGGLKETEKAKYWGKVVETVGTRTRSWGRKHLYEFGHIEVCEFERKLMGGAFLEEVPGHGVQDVAGREEGRRQGGESQGPEPGRQLRGRWGQAVSRQWGTDRHVGTSQVDRPSRGVL